mgnify:CR=1 FL=1
MVPAWKTRTRPGTYQTFTEPFLLRLSDEQKERVERAARARSKSRSDLMRDAIMTYVAGVEEEQEAKKRSRREERVERVDGSARGKSSFGLRLPEPFLRPLGAPAVSSAAPPAAPTIVIHNAPAAPAAVPDEVSVLAAYVLGARNSVDAEGRRRAVEKILLAREPREERERLARALEDRIAEQEADRKKKAAESQKSSSGWGFLSGGLR